MNYTESNTLAVKENVHLIHPAFHATEQDKLIFLVEELMEAGKETSCMALLRHLAAAESAEEEACCRELLTLLMAKQA